MTQALKLAGARVALDAHSAERMDLFVRTGRILSFDSEVSGATEVDLSGHLLLPGLINAHDHLEFGLFPRLGRGPYPNATEWAADIYHPEAPPVREHLSVPKRVRLMWGGIRNLLSGVTTVAHHNPYDVVFNCRFPLRVVKRYGWAHSLDFCTDVARRYRSTPVRWPFIIHAGEGTDERARSEISTVDEIGVLSERTVLVHATGATSQQLYLIRERGASIVWCPSSNLFTLGRTLASPVLRSGVRISLGTDSAMTAEGDLIDEIHVAAQHTPLSAHEIYNLVTTVPASSLRLNEGQGMLRPHGFADLVAVRDTGATPAEALMELYPELVMIEGRAMLMSDRFATRSHGLAARGLNPIRLEGRGQWLIRADVPSLYSSAARALGSEIRLSGKRVCP